MFALWLIIAASTVSSAVSQDDTYMSPNRPAFYKGEKGTANCTWSVTKDELAQTSGFGLIINAQEAANIVQVAFCRISRSPGVVNVDSDVLSNDGCRAAFNELKDKGTAALSIPIELMQTGEYRCSSWTSTSYKKNEILIDVTELLEAPTSLNMVFDPEEVYVGDQLSIRCESVGGKPAAVFNFEVNGNSVGNEIVPFNVSKEDEGNAYKCIDTNHPNFNNGESELTIQERKLEVYYFMATKNEIISMTADPIFTEELICSIVSNLPVGVMISYEWMKDGEMVIGEDQPELIITYDQKSNTTGDEEYSCVAKTTDPKLEDVKLTFIITWETKATTLTSTKATKQPSMETPDKDSNKSPVEPNETPTMTIVIIVVVIVVIAIVIIIIALVVYKKRKSDSSAVSKDPAEKLKDSEKGKDPEENPETQLLSQTTHSS
ncbi:uncharacterized protein [Watersipora subatra]|uniref:uncharacterized protein isoform X2 n=1 Tax=Watersipora subatra TaxID=2589382 RepID=UPI00355B90BC